MNEILQLLQLVSVIACTGSGDILCDMLYRVLTAYLSSPLFILYQLFYGVKFVHSMLYSGLFKFSFGLSYNQGRKSLDRLSFFSSIHPFTTLELIFVH